MFLGVLMLNYFAIIPAVGAEAVEAVEVVHFPLFNLVGTNFYYEFSIIMIATPSASLNCQRGRALLGVGRFPPQDHFSLKRL